MKIIRKNDGYATAHDLKPGDCVLYNGYVLIATNDTDYGMVTCVNLENGTYEPIEFSECVLKVEACVTVEG